jgi:ribosomal protein S27AE
MNSRIYPKELYQKEVNSLKVKIVKLHCPKCFSNEIIVNYKDIYTCKECSAKSDFNNLLNIDQVRDRKINSILS